MSTPDLTSRIAKRLRELGYPDAKPVVATIGRATYIGASYTDSSGGDRCLYLLGERPPSARRRIVYRLPDDDGDWYLAAWMEASGITPEVRGYHPFGPWFQLRRWSHEKLGERIDHAERHDLPPRKRMNITLGEVS